MIQISKYILMCPENIATFPLCDCSLTSQKNSSTNSPFSSIYMYSVKWLSQFLFFEKMEAIRWEYLKITLQNYQHLFLILLKYTNLISASGPST